MTLTTIKKLLIMFYFMKHDIQEPKTSMAIIIYETGHISCNNNCSLQHNNLFGFRYKNKFKRFRSYNHCIKYYKDWQVKWWIPYHKKYSTKTYYDYLKWIYYCDNIDNYIINIKKIEKQLKI